jgi:hypothetical protein
MPNSNIQWLDPKERPVDESSLGRSVCIKSEHGTIIVKLDVVAKPGGWFSSITWLNQSNYKYIILPE